MLTSLYHNMSSLILMFLFLTYLWSATIFRYEASIDSIEQLWVNHQSINQRNFIEKTKADINSNDALTKNQNCSIYLFPAGIDPSEGRGQPLGSYFSTSFCHPYLLSSLGETSCFVVVVVVLLRLYNNEPGKNLKTYNILTPWPYSISVTYVLLQSTGAIGREHWHWSTILPQYDKKKTKLILSWNWKKTRKIRKTKKGEKLKRKNKTIERDRTQNNKNNNKCIEASMYEYIRN